MSLVPPRSVKPYNIPLLASERSLGDDPLTPSQSILLVRLPVEGSNSNIVPLPLFPPTEVVPHSLPFISVREPLGKYPIDLPDENSALFTNKLLLKSYSNKTPP